MAVTRTNSTFPKDWGRVWDSNRLNFSFSSNQWQQPNFNFLIEAFRYDILTSTWIVIGTFYMYPINGGTMNFNPSIIFRNYLTNDIDISLTQAEEAINSGTQFRLNVYDYYSITGTNNGFPFKQTTGASTNNDIRLFNGAQAIVPFDDTTVGPGNPQWVISGASSGLFLTDATQYRLDNDDRAFLYWLSANPSRPTRARFTVWWWSTGAALPDLSTFGGANSQEPIPFQMLPNQTTDYSLLQGDDWDSGGGGVTPQNYVGILSAVTYLDISYAYTGSLVHYMPIGPDTMTGMSLFPSSATLSNWLYYKIDLLDVNTVLTKKPFWVIRNQKCDKYGKWELFWMGPHGNFDCFTFNKKNTITNKINRTTYKQRLLPTQTSSSYQAGERVFNTNVVEETTLRSYSLTQQEAQLLVQLTKSPIVYVLKRYVNGNTTTPYLAPYIVTSDEVLYEQKINSKEIFMEIKLRPSNEIIVQQN